MLNLTEIIGQISKDLHCPVCGRHYNTGDIHLRGLFDHTLMVQTVCSNGHLALFMTILPKNQPKPAINSNDIIDLHNALKNFNGDFQNLWSS